MKWILGALAILFFVVLLLLVQKAKKPSKGRRQGHTIADRIEKQKEEERASRLGKRLYYRIKSRLFRESGN